MSRAIDMSDQSERFDKIVAENMRRECEQLQRSEYWRRKDTHDEWRRLNEEIGANNRTAIDGARGLVAILDGADVDSGTAAEIGYAFARGKLIVGYRGDSRVSADNEGGVINLQVEYFIRQSGGTIVNRYEDLAPSLLSLHPGAS